MAKHSYLAVITKEEKEYGVSFPKFKVNGRGFEEYEDTVRFVKDMLAEILLEYEKEKRPLPEPDSQDDTHPAADKDAGKREVMITVDPDLYKKKIEEKSKRVYHDFRMINEGEGDRDKKSPDGNRRILMTAGIVILAVVAFALILKVVLS